MRAARTAGLFTTRHPSKALVVGTLSFVFAGCGDNDGQGTTSPNEPGSPPAAVVIKPASISLATGELTRVAVTVRDQGGDKLPSEVMWQSSAEGVATADFYAMRVPPPHRTGEAGRQAITVLVHAAFGWSCPQGMSRATEHNHMITQPVHPTF